VLQGLLQQCAVPAESFGPVCVVVDKAEKIPREEVVKQLAALGLPSATIDSILSVLEVGVRGQGRWGTARRRRCLGRAAGQGVCCADRRTHPRTHAPPLPPSAYCCHHH
jgi:hypothetical protein